MPQMTVPADLQHYPRLIAWLEAFVQHHQLPAPTSFALQLCLEEAFSNIVQHAYAPGRGAVRVSLELEEAAAALGFADTGPPFDPTAIAPPEPAASLADAAIGGRGIQLMRRFANHLSYRREAGENRLLLRVPLSQAP